MSELPRGVVIMLVVSVLAAAFIFASDYIIPVSAEERLRVIRPELAGLRHAADSCLAAIRQEEESLLASDARLDSLRRRIAYYEGLHPRGVPADSYEAYLEVFERYNEGIPQQSAASDSLQANWLACTRIVERHNAMADSARALAEEAGLLEEPADRVPVGGEGPGPSGETPGTRR